MVLTRRSLFSLMLVSTILCPAFSQNSTETVTTTAEETVTSRAASVTDSTAIQSMAQTQSQTQHPAASQTIGQTTDQTVGQPAGVDSTTKPALDSTTGGSNMITQATEVQEASSTQSSTQEATQDSSGGASAVTTQEMVTSTHSDLSAVQTSSGGSTTTSGIPVQETTTQEEETTTNSEAAQVCGTAVSGLPADSPCHPENHQVIKRLSPVNCDLNLPKDTWFRLTEADDQCTEIPLLADDSVCFKPGSCGADYPYYLIGRPPAAGSETTLEACTTETLITSKRFSCCGLKKKIKVHNCAGNFWVYRVDYNSLRIPRACGKFCTELPGKNFDVFSLVKDGATLPLPINTAKDRKEIKENLVTVVLKITDRKKFEDEYGTSSDIEQSLKNMIKDSLSSSRRRRRDTKPNTEVAVLEGSPIRRDDDEQTYVLSVNDGKENVVAKNEVVKAMEPHVKQDLKHPDSSGLILQEVASDVPPEFRDKLGMAAKPQPSKHQGKRSRLWIAIIVIVGITAFIVTVCFTAVLCYRLSKSRHSGSINLFHKKALVGHDDGVMDSYTPTRDVGHDNLAMNPEEGDKNANKQKPNESMNEETSVEPITAENTV